MTQSPNTDEVRAGVFVAIPQADAFEAFTGEIDAWWRRGPRFRVDPRASRIELEPRLGGQLLEHRVSDAKSTQDEAFEIGRIRLWKPPERLILSWRGRDWSADEVTEVEVYFVTVAGGTRVTIEHRGWDSLPADHPARHGLSGVAFKSMIGLWWADLMTSFRARTAA